MNERGEVGLRGRASGSILQLPMQRFARREVDAGDALRLWAHAYSTNQRTENTIENASDNERYAFYYLPIQEPSPIQLANSASLIAADAQHICLASTPPRTQPDRRLPLPPSRHDGSHWPEDSLTCHRFATRTRPAANASSRGQETRAPLTASQPNVGAPTDRRSCTETRENPWELAASGRAAAPLS